MLVQIADIEGVEESRRPGYQYGLRDVIIGLKEKKVQGFEEVAKAILQYRKEFAEQVEKEKSDERERERRSRKKKMEEGKGCSQEEKDDSEQEEEEEEEDKVMEDV